MANVNFHSLEKLSYFKGVFFFQLSNVPTRATVLGKAPFLGLYLNVIVFTSEASASFRTFSY
jgi:hypothetical protein